MTETVEKPLTWHEFTPADAEGKAWFDTEIPFGRIPQRMKDILPGLYSQSLSPTGMCLFFDTDATEIHVRYELGTPQMGEANFNETAFSGVDLYAFDAKDKRDWRWASATPHFVMKAGEQHPEYRLAGGWPKARRRFRLYLPLRNSLIRFFVGVNAGAAFTKRPPRKTRPIVYYGTSIIHGAFSVRSGLCLTSRLGRMLDKPFVNLGFSGACKMEPAMAELLAELNPAMYLVDPFHNSTEASIQANTEPFVETLCAARPKTPVLMLGAPHFTNAWILPDLAKCEEAKTAALSSICRRLARKHPNVAFVDGRGFYGSEEVSMDGVHPNDEAFGHMADVLARAIRRRLG